MRGVTRAPSFIAAKSFTDFSAVAQGGCVRSERVSRDASGIEEGLQLDLCHVAEEILRRL